MNVDLHRKPTLNYFSTECYLSRSSQIQISENEKRCFAYILLTEDETGVVTNEGDSFSGRGTGTDEAPWRRPQRPHLHRQAAQRSLPPENERDKSTAVSIKEEGAIKDDIISLQREELNELRKEIHRLQADVEKLRTRGWRSEEEKWWIAWENMETERSKVRGVQKTAESPAHNDKLEATQGNFSAQEKAKDKELQLIISENDQCKSQLNRMNEEHGKTEKSKELQIVRSENEGNTIRICEQQDRLTKLEAHLQRLLSEAKEKEDELQILRLENEEYREQTFKDELLNLEADEYGPQLSTINNHDAFEGAVNGTHSDRDQLGEPDSTVSQTISKSGGINRAVYFLAWNLNRIDSDQCTDSYLWDASTSDLKLAYIHTCSSLSAEVMNSLSMEECDRFHVHRICQGNRTAFIVVRRGKTNPKELVNIRTGDKGTVKRLIQMVYFTREPQH
ncbi:hypothetical protein B0H14DRAFT_3130015 [Mycena olivaceomarginata]|nr:hypothetical protein B0H14DRAFT_3130015 [Mycena olivaceomarginata]